MTRNGSNWRPYTLPWNDAPLDLSFLYAKEKPAGKHGFLTTKGDRFVFEDGTPARFWGTLFNSAANFPAHEYSEMVARRLAKFGVNMVRTHQMDAEWSVPNIFQFTQGRTRNDSRSLDPESLDRLDYLVYCLKKEGIYIYLDQLTHRAFKAGDGLENAYELFRPYGARGYAVFVRRLIELQQEYSRNLWTHVNPYTGLAYKDDPAVALMEVANENDLLCPVPIVAEPYRSQLEERFRAWAGERGVSVEEKKVDFTKRTPTILRFFRDVQREYYAEMIAFLRDVGVKVPITGSNWAAGGLPLVSANEPADFQDSHAYWDMWSDKHGTNKPLIKERNSTMLRQLAAMRRLDRPFFASEWDVVWPNEWRGTSPLVMAAAGCLQEWDGLTVHTYRYRTTNPVHAMGAVVMDGVGYRVNFDTFNDPAKFGLFYHAALLFRRGDVAPAKQAVEIQTDEKTMFESPPAVLNMLGTLPEEHKVGVALPEQSPTAARVLKAEEKKNADTEQAEIVSDTGEVRRSPQQGRGIIDTPRTKAAYGFLGECGTLELDGLKLTVKTPFAVIALSSLTDEPLASSTNILLTTVGRADNSGAKYNEDHTERLELGHAPVLIEVIEAKLELKAACRDLRVWSIDPEGFHTGELPVEYKDGVLKFEVGKDFPSMYYLIQQ